MKKSLLTKSLLTKVVINILLSLVLMFSVTYGWITNEVTISKNVIIQNGLIDDINISLYRGYDYDLNGTLDIKNNNATNELDRYYNDITNSTNDSVTDIMEASEITYRVKIVNSSNKSVVVKPYFFFSDEMFTNNDLQLLNNAMSILFHIKKISIITNVGEDQVIVEENINRSLCFYADSEVFTSVICAPNSTNYLDFIFKASNLTEMNNTLNEYLSYSQNKNYDLNKGIYLDEEKNVYVDSNNTVFTLSNGTDVISLDNNGKANRYVSLRNYKCEGFDTLYTNDYLEMKKVYSTKQDTSQSSALTFSFDNICFDCNYLTGSDATTTLANINNVSLTNFSYFDHDNNEVTSFYQYQNDVLTSVSSCSLTNGLFDSEGNKLYVIYDTNYQYTLIYEGLKVVKVLKEAR